MWESDKKDSKIFVIETKSGKIAGTVSYFNMTTFHIPLWEIGYTINESSRRQGYCSEAVQILVDYIFLTKLSFGFKPIFK